MTRTSIVIDNEDAVFGLPDIEFSIFCATRQRMLVALVCSWICIFRAASVSGNLYHDCLRIRSIATSNELTRSSHGHSPILPRSPGRTHEAYFPLALGAAPGQPPRPRMREYNTLPTETSIMKGSQARQYAPQYA